MEGKEETERSSLPKLNIVNEGSGGVVVWPKKTGKDMRKERRLKNEPSPFVGLGEGPSGVNILDFSEARATELKTMLKALESKGGGKRVFQYLPPHMRRRAMSHNPKRLPRRLREQASKQIEEAARKKKKPPSRKQKRKPKLLREKYSKRQEGDVWLETHIWHAKRMKMGSRYGHRVAEHCSDKGVRAAYRSLVHGCLLSDISYFKCYEVSGKQSDVIGSLSDHFHADVGLTIRAKAFLKGQREGNAVMYRAGAYPFGAIAPVHFLWQALPPATPEQRKSEFQSKEESPLPGSEQEKDSGEACIQENVSKLWIWCHPAAQVKVLSELQRSVDVHNRVFLHQDPVLGAKHQVCVIHRDLVRFRLVGPRSHAVLFETLKPRFIGDQPNLDPNDDASQSGENTSADESDNSNDELEEEEEELNLAAAEKWWLEGDYEAQLCSHESVLSAEYPAIRAASGPAVFSRGSVIGMCVQDPRLFTPSKKTDVVSSYYPRKRRHVDANGAVIAADEKQNYGVGVPIEQSVNELPDCLPCAISFSPLWDKSVSESVSKSLIPFRDLNHRRSRQRFLHSSVPKLGDSAPCIPVLLIQQTPKHLADSWEHVGAGWDLILPPEWAMAFWISLIYRGARACGMRELMKASLESQVLHFPCDFPDTVSASNFYSEQQNELETRYRARPPDKRCNYGKLVVPTPFHFSWEDLVEFWSQRELPHCSNVRVKRSADCDGIGAICKKIKRESEQSCDVSNCLNLDDPSVPDNAYAMQSQAFYVLRSRETLSSLRCFLSNALSSNLKCGRRAKNGSTPQDGATDMFQSAVWDFGIESIVRKYGSSLVAVRVEISRSGNLTCLDSLSLPLPSDLSSLISSQSFSGPTEAMNPHGMTVVEKDSITVGISPLSREEIKKLKRDGSTSASDFRLFHVRTSRLMVGYVTSAGHRLTTSLDSGLGFITVGGLIEAISCCYMAGLTRLQVLARGAKTKYYFVEMSLL